MPKCTDVVSDTAFDNNSVGCSSDTGFSFFVISAAPTPEQMTKICATPKCMNIVNLIKAAQPSECVVPFGLLLYGEVINPIEAVCAGKPVAAAPAPAPAATPAPTAATTAPSTTRSPVTSAPQAATPISAVANSTTTLGAVGGSPNAAASSVAITLAPVAQVSSGVSGSDNHVTIIVAIAGGVVVVLAFIGFLVFRTRSKRHRRDFAADYERARPTPPHRVVVDDHARYVGMAVVGNSSRVSKKKKSDTSLSSASTATSSTRASERSQSVSSRPSTASAPPPQQGLWTDAYINNAKIKFDEIQINRELRPLGRGGFCEVVAAKFGARDVAVKSLLPELRYDLEMQNMLLAEAKTMLRLKHRCVVEFVGVAWTEPGNLCLVTELIKGRDMGKYIAAQKASNAPRGYNTEKVRMALQVAEALAYLHAQRPAVLHRDLKPENVLVTDDNDAKLADFGVARETLGTLKTSQIGTKFSMAPEQALTKKYDEKVDIFAFGVLLSELGTHEAPYSQTRNARKLPDADFFDQVMNGRLTVTFPGDESDDVSKLGRDCVSPLPQRRPTAADVFQRLHEIHAECLQRDIDRRATETF